MRFPALSLLFLFIISLSFHNPISAQCLDDQKSFLLTLFDSEDNDLSWTPNTDCCSWEGITCDSSTGHVIGLDLTNQSISGSINSTSLISISSLQSLNLSLNHFNCSIPNGLDSLSNLIHLNLSFSGFTGLVPIEVSRMKSLVSLDLSFLFSLALPSPDFGYLMGNLTGLRELHLDGIQISAPVPEFMVELVNLSSLHLFHCNLSGEFPSKIFHMQNLESLDVSFNSFLTGALPEFPLNSTGRLQIMILSGTQFSGHLPDSFGNLKFLTKLDIGYCNFDGSIPSSMASINQLVHLDLRSNNFSGETNWLGNLTQLVHLDLSHNDFSGQIHSLSNLAQLGSLSFSRNRFHGQISSLANLSQLYFLDLSGNNLSGRIPSSLFMTPSFKTIDLSSNNFQGEIEWLGNLTRLIHLSLSDNDFSGQIHSLSSLAQLESLSFSRNRFHGQISSLANLSQLSYLDLSSNHFSGQFPSLNSTCLFSLDLSSNSFSGQIPSLPIQSISSLDLSINNLSGRIPSSLFMIPSLLTIQLNHNQFDGQLDEFHNASVALSGIFLSNNKLQGQIPRSVGQLVGLSILDLSWNNFNEVDLAMLRDLKNLLFLDLSNNPLSINSSDWNSPSFPQLSILFLSSCNLTRFPGFLASLSELLALDLSYNKIDGEIPNWIWTIGNGNLIYLNLSHNLATSLERPPINTLSSRLLVIDLHCNKISGPVPSSFCNLSQIELLDLSNNNFNGTIPRCLVQIVSTLSVLNFANNRLSGTLPQNFTDKCRLEMINLNDNQFEGSLPRSLANCKQLEVLNLGNNQIEDSFPFWLGSLPQLKILMLRSNKFYGLVEQGRDDNYFSQLQIIDLSSNGFTGKLSSKFFRSLKAMMVGKFGIQTFGLEVRLNATGEYYQESVKIITKGQELEFSKALSILVSIDLSNNEFEGDILEEIGNLKLLNVLNMSHNNFTGLIPSSFKNLLQLESLDLSANKLSGEIPIELTSLTFLSFLNLSENHFVGSIPRGNQFSTFLNNSFQENPGLCGPPLVRDCHSVEPPLTSEYAYLHSENKFDWEFIGMGLSLGFGVGIWMVWGPLIFWANGRRWYYKQMDKLLIMAKAWWER